MPLIVLEHGLHFNALLKVYRVADLTLVYPLVRGGASLHWGLITGVTIAVCAVIDSCASKALAWG